MGRKNRGMALISTFMFVGLLFIMAASMVVTSRNRVFTGVSQYHQSQAFYLAESGLVRSMAALETDLSWPGVTDATIDGMPGTYTVTFGNDKFGSVNNIGGITTKDGYRGPSSVPVNSAVLIVQANVSGQQYVLEALVDGQGSIGFMSDAILASGKIQAHGDFHIDGISSLDDDAPVDGSIQSNMSSGDDLITWSGGGLAEISGTVGTSGSTSSAINMPGANMGGTELNSVHNIPSYDIDAEISSNSGSSPGFVDGDTTTLGAGKYKISGDEVVNGDIVLQDGAEIYVDGNFTINGSIEGNGTVWVSGNTTLKGDSSVTTGHNDENVSLYVKGNVKLTGFEGTKYMQSLDAETQQLLAIAEEAIFEFQQGAKGATTTEELEFPMWSAGVVLGLHLEGSEGGQGEQVTYDFGNGLGDNGNVLGQLNTKIETLASGPTKEFLSERTRQLTHMFSSADDVVADDPSSDVLAEEFMIPSFLDAGETHGILDSIIGLNRDDLVPQFVNLLDTVNYDKPGAAYFQGSIYTQGYFYADNEVNVLGAIMVDGDGTGEETFDRLVYNPATKALEPGESVTLSSGDIYLGSGTRVTYVEEFFTDDLSDVSGPQNLARALWMGR
jgi:cytoskeletal protein CcmA (bactofilin family)